MTWFPGEPSLDEILADPMVLALMRSDGVSPSALRLLVSGFHRSRSSETDDPTVETAHQGSPAPS